MPCIMILMGLESRFASQWTIHIPTDIKEQNAPYHTSYIHVKPANIAKPSLAIMTVKGEIPFILLRTWRVCLCICVCVCMCVKYGNCKRKYITIPIHAVTATQYDQNDVSTIAQWTIPMCCDIAANPLNTTLYVVNFTWVYYMISFSDKMHSAYCPLQATLASTIPMCWISAECLSD